MARLFISHASRDKALADAFVDLLQTGLQVPIADIFCTSLEGMKIPGGASFVEFIRQELIGTKLAVALITPSYYESSFCLCELGAVWGLGHSLVPLLVPPVDRGDLRAVLVGATAPHINDKTDLDDLHDRVKAALEIAGGPTARWNVKRDAFLQKFVSLQVAPYRKVDGQRHAEVQGAYEQALSEAAEHEKRFAALQEKFAEVAALKDERAVREIQLRDSDELARFSALRDEAGRALNALPNTAREAIYFEYAGQDYYPDHADRNAWDAINAAEREGFVRARDEGPVVPNERDPTVKAAIEAIEALSGFIDGASREFRESFAAEHRFELSLANRRLWRLLGVRG